MGYRLAIENRVAVQVKGKIPGATRGSHVNFNFTLDMERIDQDQVTAAQVSGENIADFLVARTRGWDGQRLVLDAQDSPAAYGDEAFRQLMQVPGMSVWIYHAYLRDLGVQEKAG